MPDPLPLMGGKNPTALLATEGAGHRVRGIKIRDLNGHHAVLVDNVGLFDERPLVCAHDRHGRDVDVVTAQSAIEGEDDLAVRLEVATRHPRVIE